MATRDADFGWRSGQCDAAVAQRDGPLGDLDLTLSDLQVGAELMRPEIGVEPKGCAQRDRHVDARHEAQISWQRAHSAGTQRRPQVQKTGPGRGRHGGGVQWEW